MTDKPTHPHQRAAPRPAAPLLSRLLARVRRGLEALRHHRHRNPRIYGHGLRGLLALVAIVAVAQAGLWAIGWIDTVRLSGTAQVEIVSTVVTGGSSYDQSPSGTTLHYAYVVGGITYTGTDFRRWLNIDAHRPKVCFDPGEPSHHLLVEGSYRCGTGP